MTLNRREMLALGAFPLLAPQLWPSVATGQEFTFGDILDVVESDEDALLGAGWGLEWKEAAAEGMAIVAAISDGRKSKTPIADGATRMIVMFEVTSEKVYNRKYQRPIWPHGRSGVTIGIGYDLGYVEKARFQADWKDYITSQDISYLEGACLKKGSAAQDLAPKLQNFKVDFASAHKQFVIETLPRYVGQTEDALANCDLLSPASLGALVSLTFNRGASYRIPEKKDPKGRYSEMRNILAHLRSKEFAKVPGEIRSMKRIWQGDPKMKGLLTRRELEAKLFEAGLK
jgi:hypothetical protein